MKKRIIQGLILFLGGGVITFLLYDTAVLNLTNIYKKKICVKEYCIKKPKDWLPLVVKKAGNSYLYGEFLKNDMPISETYLADETDGIVLTKDDAEVVTYEYIEQRKTKSKLLSKEVINGKTYYIMRKRYFTVVLFPELKMSFTISGAFNHEYMVKHLISTSTKNNEGDFPTKTRI